MKTKMNIPRQLLEEAVALSSARTKTGAAVLALEDYVRRRRIERLLEQAGRLPFADDTELERARHAR